MATDITLPVSGQTNWDIPLNQALTTTDTDATNALSNIANHSANVPADPHGDRAFAQSLVSPITAGTNLPNGYVKLDGSGHIPASLISGTSAGGLYTKVYDAVGLYGMFTGTSDTSTQLQNALNAAAGSGGGIVYVAPGLYSLGNYVVIGSNTWLLLAEGAILQRIQGATNPPYIISNIQFGTNNTPATNFKITGGKLDAVGTQNLGSACTPIFVLQSTKTEIRDVWINSVFNNPAIELNGCSVIRLDWLHLDGKGSLSTQATVPAIRINSSETGTTPAGLLNSLYNNAVCDTIKISNCDTQIAQSNFGCFGSFSASDLNPLHPSTGITFTSCSTKYASNNSTPITFTQWPSYAIDNCIFYEDTLGVNNGWFNATLQHGWTNITGQVRMQYRHVEGPPNSVQLRGRVNPGTVTNGTVVFTLPAAFTPAFSIDLPVVTDVNSGSGQMPHFAVGTDGSVACWGISGSAGLAAIHAIYSLDT